MKRTPTRNAVAVNQVATTVSPDFAKFATPRGSVPAISPIDAYYAEAARLLQASREPWCTERHVALLLIELVSCVELFVRDLLVGLVVSCPSATSASARKQVSLASLRYYAECERAYAVFDHQALSGVAEICKATKAIVGVEIKQNAPVYAALSVFDSVCQLRHAVVHQGGRLAPHNLLELKLDKMPLAPVVVRLNSLLFEELLLVTHSVVRAYNQHLFDCTLTRWMSEDVLTLRWAGDGPLFEAVLPLFHSTTDVPILDPKQVFVDIGGVV
jgi:hypothetical protein